VQERILEVRHDRPRLRPCPPFRPRGPASSRHLVGLLTHELERSHAFSPPRLIPQDCQGDNGSNATALSPEPGVSQTRAAPEHSGGAVPDSHRSSLFAGGKQRLSPGHQSRRRSVPIGQRLSTMPARPGETARFARRRHAMANPAGREAVRREAVTVARGRAARPGQAVRMAVFAPRARSLARGKKPPTLLKPLRRHRR
jgi:hypothetical protein